MSKTEPSATAAEERGGDAETRWTDAQIRWPDEEIDKNNGDDDESENGAPIDPFQDPDPFETFSFRFPHPSSSTTSTSTNTITAGEEVDDNNNNNAFIDIALRGYKAESDQIWESTGLTLWRAAQHLCEYLVNHVELLQNKRILELGAGLGLCGILAHRMTSSSASESNTNNNETAVFLTDGDTDALVQLRENVERNKSKISEGIISSHQLLWGRQTAMDFLERAGHGQTFDVVLASDVIYVADIIPPLWETIQTLLNPDGLFLLAYAKRKVPVSFDLVLSAAQQAGFTHECLQEDNADDGLYLYAFRWKNDNSE